MENILNNIHSIKYKNKTFILNDELKNKLLFIITIEKDKQSLKEDIKCVEV